MDRLVATQEYRSCYLTPHILGKRDRFILFPRALVQKWKYQNWLGFAESTFPVGNSTLHILTGSMLLIIDLYFFLFLGFRKD